MKSANHILFSGRLAADAKELSNGAKAIRVIRNMGLGKDKGYKAIALDFIILPKHMGKEVTVQEDLLRKGAAVLVSGRLISDRYTASDGTVVYGPQFQAISVENAQDADTEEAPEQE